MYSPILAYSHFVRNYISLNTHDVCTKQLIYKQIPRYVAAIEMWNHSMRHPIRADRCPVKIPGEYLNFQKIKSPPLLFRYIRGPGKYTLLEVRGNKVFLCPLGQLLEHLST